MVAVARRLLQLLGLPNPAMDLDGSDSTGPPPAAAAAPATPAETRQVHRQARPLLIYLRMTLERLLGADGLGSVEDYIAVCGAAPPVQVTAGGSVVLPAVDSLHGAILPAFDRACATLPTFSPRELAVTVVPTVHALQVWEAMVRINAAAAAASDLE